MLHVLALVLKDEGPLIVRQLIGTAWNADHRSKASPSERRADGVGQGEQSRLWGEREIRGDVVKVMLPPGWRWLGASREAAQQALAHEEPADHEQCAQHPGASDRCLERKS